MAPREIRLYIKCENSKHNLAISILGIWVNNSLKWMPGVLYDYSSSSEATLTNINKIMDMDQRLISIRNAKKILFFYITYFGNTNIVNGTLGIKESVVCSKPGIVITLICLTWKGVYGLTNTSLKLWHGSLITSHTVQTVCDYLSMT